MAQEKEKEEQERMAMTATSIYLSELLLPGLEFNPGDNDLVEFYLPRKLRSLPLPSRLFYDFDVYCCNPTHIPTQFAAALALPRNYEKEKNKKMYFFTPRHPSSANPSSSAASSLSTAARFNRTAGDGFWHGNSDVKMILDGDGKIVGRKTSYQFKKICINLNGKSTKRSAINTNWIMHEYLLPNHKIGDVVLCVMYEKKTSSKEGDSQRDSDERRGLQSNASASASLAAATAAYEKALACPQLDGVPDWTTLCSDESCSIEELLGDLGFA